MFKIIINALNMAEIFHNNRKHDFNYMLIRNRININDYLM